jgi:hypothetical protein
MSDPREPLQQLSEIRSLMEASTRFVSLSGLSGVAAGVVALVGAGWTYAYLRRESILRELLPRQVFMASMEQYYTLVGMALVILLAALGGAIFFTVRNSKRQGKPIWTRASQRLLINLLIPLAAGGFFCLQLAWYGFSGMVPGATLIFYGLALLNAGKYTLREIRLLGISEVVLGLIATWVLEYSIIFWALGFGVLHIVYGLIMYQKYER